MCKLYLKVSLKKGIEFDPSATAEQRRSGLTCGQRDGFGFCSQHGLWKSADVNQRVGKLDPRLPARWRGTSSVMEVGDVTAKSWFVLAHSRTSTNKGGLYNAHPFAGPQWALAHNGVVSEVDASNRTAESLPNDSARLHAWLEAGGKMKKAHKYWGGYGAVIAYNIQQNEIHIWRDGATLVWQISGDVLEVATQSSDIPGLGESTGNVPNQTHTVITSEGNITCERWTGFALRNEIQTSYYSRTNPGSCVRESFPDWRGPNYNDDNPRSVRVRTGHHKQIGFGGVMTADEAMEAAEQAAEDAAKDMEAAEDRAEKALESAAQAAELAAMTGKPVSGPISSAELVNQVARYDD